MGVGTISAEHAALLRACEDALWQGIAQARGGGRLGDIGHAVEASVARSGRYGVVEEYTGHGIGTAMHMDPPVPNYGRAGRGPRLRAGMALAIEPMMVLGNPETVLLGDGWTVTTADGSWAAHFEHTVAITPAGPWVLTAKDGGQSRLGDTRDKDPASVPPASSREAGGRESREVGRVGWSGKPGGRPVVGKEGVCPVPGDPRIRASDADRDRATALLREHHAAGRLTAEEFSERMDAALDAKTLGELDELLTDLPVIDLYRLPDESMRRAAGLPHQSLVPRDPGSPPAVLGRHAGHGGVGRGRGRAHRPLGGRGGGRRRDLVSVVAAGRDPVDMGRRPARPAPPGIATGRPVSYYPDGSR